MPRTPFEMSSDPAGLLVIDKPSGLTSYDCVHRIKKILGQKRVGHCGTLDPLAEGVLLVLFGTHTAYQDYFQGMEKQYWFRAELGRTTDSGDRDGSETGRSPFDGVTRQALADALVKFRGPMWQVPPKVSAIKYGGKRLYEWARQGIEVPRPPRRVEIYSSELLTFDPPYWEARVICSRGTYIRSLVTDVGDVLKCGAVVDALIRERIGSFRREEAVTWPILMGCSAEQLLEHSNAEKIDRFSLNSRHF
jgi:tRNA pseudouridine55 synthase